MPVSILIANWNYGAYLGAAIDSALGQTYPEVEVVVVDDGSTDDSRAIIDSYGDRIVSRFKANGGQASAMNLAFQESRGELICLLDSDDVFEPEKVERVVTAASRMPEAHLIHHRMRIARQDGTPTRNLFPRHLPGGDVRTRAIRAGGWFPHPLTSALTFRRTYLERMFPLPTHHVIDDGAHQRRLRVYLDTYLARPAALLAPVVAIDDPLSLYRGHSDNISSKMSASERMLRHRAESAALGDVMHQSLDQVLSLTMDHHLEYQLARCAVREASRVSTVGMVLRSDALPVAERIREAVRVGVNRGHSARA